MLMRSGRACASKRSRRPRPHASEPRHRPGRPCSRGNNVTPGTGPRACGGITEATMATEFDLFCDFELQGYWWLPEEEDRKVAGTLARRNQEINLNLLDALVEQSEQEMGIVRPPPRPEIILGWLDTGEVCTLYKNFQAGSTLNSTGF